MDALGDLISARGFALGLLWGCLAVLLSPLLARLGRRSIVNVGGLAFAAGSWIGVRAWAGPSAAPLLVAVALAVLAFGGAAVDHVELRIDPRLPRAAIAPALALAPGALLLAVAVPVHHPLWVPLTIFVVTPLIGGLLHDFDRIHSARSAPLLLLAISVVGAYLTLPHTEMLLVIAGVSVPLAILSYPQPLAALGPAGSAAVAGVYCWVCVVSGITFPGAIVGALGALGLLVVEPIGRRFRKRLLTEAMRKNRRRRSRELAARYGERWIVVASTAAVCQIVMMLYAARVAGMERTAFMALVALVPMLVVAAFVVAEIVPFNESGAPPSAYDHRSHRHSAAGPRSTGRPPEVSAPSRSSRPRSSGAGSSHRRSGGSGSRRGRGTGRPQW